MKHFGWSIHSIDKGCRDAALRRMAAVVLIRQPGEEQAFDEGPELCRNLEEVHGRGKHDAISVGRLAQRFCEVVLTCTDIQILLVFQLT